ncbi:MAG: hypothetical protein ACLUOF_07360 [Ruminococcus sp.]
MRIITVTDLVSSCLTIRETERQELDGTSGFPDGKSRYLSIHDVTKALK